MIVLGWSAPTVNAVPAGYYSDQKVVYHNDGGTPDNATYFKRMLTSINNHIEAVGKVDDGGPDGAERQDAGCAARYAT